MLTRVRQTSGARGRRSEPDRHIRRRQTLRTLFLRHPGPIGDTRGRITSSAEERSGGGFRHIQCARCGVPARGRASFADVRLLSFPAPKKSSEAPGFRRTRSRRPGPPPDVLKPLSQPAGYHPLSASISPDDRHAPRPLTRISPGGRLHACTASLRARGGEGEIRTHGTREGTTVFETVPIDHSGTSPRAGRYSTQSVKGKQAGPEQTGEGGHFPVGSDTDLEAPACRRRKRATGAGITGHGHAGRQSSAEARLPGGSDKGAAGRSLPLRQRGWRDFRGKELNCV